MRAVLNTARDIIGLLRIDISAVRKDDTGNGSGDRRREDEVVIIRGHRGTRPCIMNIIVDPVVDVDIIPTDRVGNRDVICINSGLGKLSGIGLVAAHFFDCRIPAAEFIGILQISRFGRGLAVVGRSFAEGNGVCLKQRSVPVIPCDGIGVGCGSEHRAVGSVIGHRRQRIEDRLSVCAPTRKGIRVLSGRFLGRSLAGVNRGLAVS